MNQHVRILHCLSESEPHCLNEKYFPWDFAKGFQTDQNHSLIIVRACAFPVSHTWSQTHLLRYYQMKLFMFAVGSCLIIHPLLHARSFAYNCVSLQRVSFTFGIKVASVVLQVNDIHWPTCWTKFDQFSHIPYWQMNIMIQSLRPIFVFK